MPRLSEIRPEFGAEIRELDTASDLSGADVAFVETAINRYGVLVFKDQAHLDDEGQLRFSERFGRLHRSITVDRPDLERRLRRDELSDISNVAPDGSILSPEDARRVSQRATLLWHTDNSFREPAGLFTLLCARILPPTGGDTEFADIRGAFEALPRDERKWLRTLQVEHSLAHSRRLAGTGGVFEGVEDDRFPGVVQPLIRRHEGGGREALYIGSHAARVVGWPYAESQELLNRLLVFATQPQFVYRHQWSPGDLVMWDNRSTLHRATPFDDRTYPRDMRRTSLMISEGTHDYAKLG